MPSLEQNINILNEKIEEFREEKKNMFSFLSKVQEPSNYFKSLNIIPIDVYDTYIKPRMGIGELLHNNHMASCKCIISQGLPTVINKALWYVDTYFNEVIKGFCLAHNIKNQSFVDSHYLRKIIRDNDFYQLDYLPNFQTILNLRYEVVFNAWTNELKLKDEIINNHQERLLLMINTANWAIPLRQIPENSLLEIFEERPNEWGDNNLEKVEALIIKKVCKKLVKIEPIFGHFYNLGSKQLKFNSCWDLNDYLSDADHYKLFKIDRDGDKIGQYKLDDDGDMFLE